MRQHSPTRFALMFLVHHIESAGVPESDLRAKLKLEDGWLASLEHAELLALVPRLLRAAQRLLDDDLMCLHAGEQFHFCLAGAGGLAATHAPTPARALETFGRFARSDDVVRVESSTSPEATVFHVEVTAAWPRPIRDQVVEGFLSALVAALRAVGGASCTPLEVRLRRAEPADPRSFTRCLHAGVSFGCTRDEIVFRTPELAKTSLLHQPLLYEQLCFVADLSTGEPSGCSPLRQLVEQAVRSGDHSIEQVATTLRINRRTLQRRLRREGVTFRSVLSEVRVALAEELFRSSDLSVDEVARRLRYGDDKALRKAFKAVTGKTPSEVREERGPLPATGT